MKALLLLALLAQSPAVPAAPTPAGPVMRGDVHGVIGWQNVRNHAAPNHYNDWVNDIFYGAVGAGWYWTDHLKTQIDVGAGTRGDTYGYRDVVVDGVPTFEASRLRTQQTSLAVGQHYQFFRNQWFHPHAGAGVDFARRSILEEYQPVTVYDNVSRTARVIAPARTEKNNDFVTRPFVETGFKAYVTRKAFFTSDARVLFRSGFDEVLFRFGFGVDF
jgi:hypothetical protein